MRRISPRTLLYLPASERTMRRCCAAFVALERRLSIARPSAHRASRRAYTRPPPLPPPSSARSHRREMRSGRTRYLGAYAEREIGARSQMTSIIKSINISLTALHLVTFVESAPYRAHDLVSDFHIRPLDEDGVTNRSIPGIRRIIRRDIVSRCKSPTCI